MLVVIGLIALLLIAVIAVRPWRKPTVTPETAAGEAALPIEGVAPVAGRSERGPPLPVVLVHGLFGFDRIGVPGARFDYFRGIARHLETLGCQAHAVRLPAAASVPDRARELVSAIDALAHERIDLIAHS